MHAAPRRRRRRLSTPIPRGAVRGLLNAVVGQIFFDKTAARRVCWCRDAKSGEEFARKHATGAAAAAYNNPEEEQQPQQPQQTAYETGNHGRGRRRGHRRYRVVASGRAPSRLRPSGARRLEHAHGLPLRRATRSGTPRRGNGRTRSGLFTRKPRRSAPRPRPKVWSARGAADERLVHYVYELHTSKAALEESSIIRILRPAADRAERQ